MLWKTKLEVFIAKHGSVGAICEDCINFRKEKFQERRKNIVFSLKDLIKAPLPGPDSQSEYVWMEVMQDIDDNYLQAEINSVPVIATQYKEGDSVTVAKMDIMDFIDSTWDEETMAKHIYLTLMETKENHEKKESESGEAKVDSEPAGT